MKEITSALILNKLVFDKIEFNRKGFRNSNEAEFQMEGQISGGNDDNYRVVLTIKGEKKDEYDFLISLSGFFGFNAEEELSSEVKINLINKNAVSILMPYLRSEVSLLTAQPEVECIVLPPFNVMKMLEE